MVFYGSVNLIQMNERACKTLFVRSFSCKVIAATGATTIVEMSHFSQFWEVRCANIRRRHIAIFPKIAKVEKRSARFSDYWNSLLWSTRNRTHNFFLVIQHLLLPRPTSKRKTEQRNWCCCRKFLPHKINFITFFLSFHKLMRSWHDLESSKRNTELYFIFMFHVHFVISSFLYSSSSHVFDYHHYH